ARRHARLAPLHDPAARGRVADRPRPLHRRAACPQRRDERAFHPAAPPSLLPADVGLPSRTVPGRGGGLEPGREPPPLPGDVGPRRGRRRQRRGRRGVGLPPLGAPSMPALADAALRRLLDVTVSGPLLRILSPPFALLALLVRVTSPGPALFRQTRIGRHGRPFVLLKL